MNARKLLCMGECLMELRPADGGLLKPCFAGNTFGTARYARENLSPDFAVDYFTAVGDDPLSASLLGFMHEVRIGIGHVRIVPNARIGLSLVHLDEFGERDFLHWRDRSAARHLADDAQALRSAIEGAAYIHFAGTTLAMLPQQARETLLAELRRAKAAGATIVLDLNMQSALRESRQAMREMCAEAVRASGIVLSSLEVEREHSGALRPEDVIARYRDLGARAILLKCGAEHLLLAGGSDIVSIPAALARQARQPSAAAAERFAGVFIARLMQGESVEIAARQAALVAEQAMGQADARSD